jgi:hypothetical protein
VEVEQEVEDHLNLQDKVLQEQIQFFQQLQVQVEEVEVEAVKAVNHHYLLCLEQMVDQVEVQEDNQVQQDHHTQVEQETHPQ